MEWEPHIKVMEVHSFFDLANYYRAVHCSIFMHDCTTHKLSWEWSSMGVDGWVSDGILAPQSGHNEEFILTVPGYVKVLKVETYSSDFAIRIVLVQEDTP